ncbi:TetR family transcriptional regulator [Emergencia timonensis]|uniref:TetR/AcrR family transcriptional regulator n=1 Tax=Emergencia timonensis TaxID=1776384 RepID=UPI0008340F37|nr:TetR family transcriptional regulator [Emergencia timonensis]WNX90423.1 TetR family transcriptional regulator [Emergencia timonensis]
MPPKVKTSKDDIVKAALEVAKKEGVSAISAKSVSSQLGTSVAPIFRVFATIEELRNETVSQIYAQYIAYLKDYPFERSKFFTYGLAYIQFAKEYPNLFNALMEWGFFTADAIGKEVSNQFGFIEDSVASLSSLSVEQAQELFYHVWLYTHGIACLICKGSLHLSEEEEKKLLITAFESFLRNYQ